MLDKNVVSSIYSAYLLNVKANDKFIKHIKLADISRENLVWKNIDFFKNEYLSKTSIEDLADSLLNKNSIWLFSIEKNNPYGDKVVIRQGKHRVMALFYLVDSGIISDQTTVMCLEENVERTPEKGTYSTVDNQVDIVVPLDLEIKTKHSELIFSKNKNFVDIYMLNNITFGWYKTNQTIWMDFFAELIANTYINYISNNEEILKNKEKTINFKINR
jgi:hypothetical protein